jgi:hypothetical protein
MTHLLVSGPADRKEIPYKYDINKSTNTIRCAYGSRRVKCQTGGSQSNDIRHSCRLGGLPTGHPPPPPTIKPLHTVVMIFVVIF